MTDLVVIGGGIMGLGVAWRAALAGLKVAVYDSGQPGREASWAAAGMLAPLAEAEFHEHEQLELAEESQRRWPEFAALLRDATGLDVGYDTAGTLLVAVDRDDAEQIERLRRHLVARGRRIEWLDADAARQLVPALSPAIVGAAHCPGDHQVDNRAVLDALLSASERAGVRIVPDAPVVAVRCDSGRVRGVTLASGEDVDAAAVLVAAGAWCRQLGGLERRIPVRPVRGQMMALQMDAAAPLTAHVVRGLRSYLVPRSDGRLIVGATSEERGFERALTAGGLFALLENARELLPGVDELNVHSTWVGFRPASRDHGPLLGPGSPHGLHFATGHYRHGIQLAPASIALATDSILGKVLPRWAAPFSPTRFGL